jgi:stress-induced morphogen
VNRQKKIQSMVSAAINVVYLDIINESHMHSVPENSETHFKLTLVSNEFDGMSKVARHQKVYGAVSVLMQEGLHALALHTYSPDEWALKNQQSPQSPGCMGGSKGD